MKKITIEFYDKQYQEAHSAFAEKMFPNRRFKSDPEYLYWKFKPPKESDRPSNLLIALSNEQVVGQVGLVPATLICEDVEIVTQWLGDVMVDTDFRGFKLSHKLYEEAVKLTPLTLSQSPSPVAWNTFKSFGFESVDGPYRCILPLNGDFFASFFFKPGTRLHRISRMLFSNIFFQRNKLKGINTNFMSDISEIRPIDIINKSSYFNKKISIPHIKHGKEFFNWRTNSPKRFPREMKCIETENGSFCLFGKNGNSLVMFDYVITSISDGRRLINKMLDIYFNDDISDIRSCLYPYYPSISLKELGFFQYRTPEHICYYPKTAIISNYTNFHYCFFDSDGSI